jgi:hypothetical protein
MRALLFEEIWEGEASSQMDARLQRKIGYFLPLLRHDDGFTRGGPTFSRNADKATCGQYESRDIR